MHIRILFFLLVSLLGHVANGQQTTEPAGDCGSQQYDSPSSTKDVFDLKDRSEASLKMAFDRLEQQVATVDFDEEAVKNWIQSLPADQVPDLPFVDEDKTIKDIADLVSELIAKAENLLKAEATKALKNTKSTLTAAFNAAVANLTPKGVFAADAAWLNHCCGSTGYWSNPSVTKAGKTAERATAAFDAKVNIGGSVGVEATTKCSISFKLQLSLSLTSWSNVRFWPPAKEKGDESNRMGCSVTVKALPNWKATYDTQFGAGVLLIITLGKGADLENEPLLKEVDAVLKITDPKP